MKTLFRITWQHISGIEKESQFDAKNRADAIAEVFTEYGSNVANIVKCVSVDTGETE